MSKQDFDQAQTSYDAAYADVKSLDAQVNQQQVQLKYYSVFSPTDGIVGDVPVHVGDRVTNTTPLTTIDERRALEVYIAIPSEHARGNQDGRSRGGARQRRQGIAADEGVFHLAAN